MSTQAESEQLLSRYDEKVAALARSVRTWVMGAIPHATETVDATANLFGYSVAPGYKGLVCTIIMSKTGVKLGISNGASLPDTQHLLAGSGKKHRYVQINDIEVLENPALLSLLKTALARIEA
jgi:hypothetical protein